MPKDEVIERLRAHEADLRAEGVVGLALFGSVARQTDLPSSDVDIAATFDHTKVRTLIDLAAAVRAIRACAGDPEVDVADAESLRSSVRSAFEKDHVRIF